MFHPKVIFTLTSVILLHNLSASVTVDLSKADNKECGAENGWSLVDLDKTLVTSRLKNKSVLKASSFSCASFPLNVLHGTLVMSVYVEARFDSRIEVQLRDQDESILNYVYDKKNIAFEQGWHTITLPIDREAAVYVTLLGISQKEDIVIVESIEYYNKDMQPQGEIKILDLRIGNEINLKSILHENDRDEYIVYETKRDANSISPTKVSNFKYTSHGNDTRLFGKVWEQGAENFREQDADKNNTEEEEEGDETDNQEIGNDEGSGDVSNTTEENTTTAPAESTAVPSTDESSSSFWNVWTITLISVASVTLVAIVVIGAYYLGKTSGKETTIPMDLDNVDLEAPRIIPRVKTARTPYDRFGSEFGESS